MTTRERSRIITVIPCAVPLTMVYLGGIIPNKEGSINPIPHYEAIVAIMYRTSHDGEYFDPVPSYSSDYISFRRVNGDHVTSEEGPCDCTRRGERRCGDFGILAGTPDELREDVDLTGDIRRRIVHLIEVNARDAEKKEKNRANSRRYREARRNKEEALTKATPAPIQEPERETVVRRVPARASNIREIHQPCGKPLPRSLEELASFGKQWGPGGQPPDSTVWWCICGTAEDTNEAVPKKTKSFLGIFSRTA